MEAGLVDMSAAPAVVPDAPAAQQQAAGADAASGRIGLSAAAQPLALAAFLSEGRAAALDALDCALGRAAALGAPATAPVDATPSVGEPVAGPVCLPAPYLAAAHPALGPLGVLHDVRSPSWPRPSRCPSYFVHPCSRWRKPILMIHGISSVS